MPDRERWYEDRDGRSRYREDHEDRYEADRPQEDRSFTDRGESRRPAEWRGTQRRAYADPWAASGQGQSPRNTRGDTGRRDEDADPRAGYGVYGGGYGAGPGRRSRWDESHDEHRGRRGYGRGEEPDDTYQMGDPYMRRTYRAEPVDYGARYDRERGGGAYSARGGFEPYDPGFSQQDYDPDRYTPNPREGRGEGNRSSWDRAADRIRSWFGDERAERRREWDHAQAPHRGRGPKGYVRTDERIREDLSERLTDNPWLDASNVEVTVAGAEVTLSGTVPDRESKRRAEDIADDVSGVKHVQNNLRVGPALTGARGETVRSIAGQPVSGRVGDVSDGDS